MNLTEHFTLLELTQSPTAKAKGIANTPTKEHLSNMKFICEQILEPIRAQFARPVTVHSSYRCQALNQAVGGATSSQHLLGQAVDFEIQGVSNVTVADWVSENLEYDQVILEFFNPKEGANSGWVHVSLNPQGKNRKQKLIAIKDGKTTRYEPTQDFDPTRRGR